MLGGGAYFEICVLTDGSAVHASGTRRVDAPATGAHTERVGPGTVILAEAGGVHAFERPRGLGLYAVAFLPAWLLDDLRASWEQEDSISPLWSTTLLRAGKAARTTRISLPVDTLRAAVRELEDLRTDYAAASPLFRKAALLKLMALIAGAYQAEPHAHDEATHPMPVARILDEIEHSLNEGRPFRMTDAAAAAAMTSDHLCRLFRDATGESPRSYYQRRRAQAAARLLLDPARPVAEIAAALGYCDAAHFCNTFKRVQGESPSAYRRRHGR